MPFPGDLTVFEAVMDAMPDDRTANLGRVRLIRADPRDPLIIYVNLAEMLEVGDSTFNIHIQERDIIVVPPTILAAARLLPDQAALPGDRGHARDLFLARVLLPAVPQLRSARVQQQQQQQQLRLASGPGPACKAAIRSRTSSTSCAGGPGRSCCRRWWGWPWAMPWPRSCRGATRPRPRSSCARPTCRRPARGAWRRA